MTTPPLVAMDCGIRPSLSSVLCNVPCMSTDDDASPGNHGNYGLWDQAATLVYYIIFHVCLQMTTSPPVTMDCGIRPPLSVYYIMFHVCLQVTTLLLVTMDCGIRPPLSVYYIMFHVCLQMTTPPLVAMDCGIRPSISSVLCNVPCMSTDDDASPGNHGNYGLWDQAATLVYYIMFNLCL